MVGISRIIFEINQANSVDTIEQNIIESLAKILVGEFDGKLRNQRRYIVRRESLSIDTAKTVPENLYEDVGICMNFTLVFLE